MRTSKSSLRGSAIRGLMCCALPCIGGLATHSHAQFEDACASAATVGEGVFTFDLTTASSAPAELEPSCADDRRPFIDQWIRYVATASGPVAFSTEGLSTGDTVLSIHGDFGCPEDLFSERACNDNSGGLQSRIQMFLSAGESVLVRVAGAFESRPTGSVSIEAIAPLEIGDVCENPGTAVLGINTYDSSRSAQNGFGCWSFQDVWFEFTPAVRGALTVQTCDHDTNGQASLHQSCSGDVIACVEYDACGLSAGVEAGVPLLIRIANDTASGPQQFTISIDPNGLPGNDDCSAATVALEGRSDFDNTFATTDFSAVCPGGGPFDFNAGLDVWFTFAPLATGMYDISTEESLGISDTRLAISTACNEQPFACNGDARGFLSFIRTPLIAGVTYYVQVSGEGLPLAGTPIDRGAGVLSIRRSIAPSNDECETAHRITDGITAYDVYDATTGPQQVTCVGPQFATSNDVWFEYVPQADGVFEFTLLPGGAAGHLAVYPTCEGDLPIHEAGRLYMPQVGYGVPSAIVNGRAGVPLLIRVAYLQIIIDPQLPYGAGELFAGPVTVPGPANDACADAAVITDGTTEINLVGSIKDCNASEGPQFDSCAALTDNDLFFRYSPSASGQVIVMIEDGVDYPYFDGLIASVYNACGEQPFACSFLLGDAPASEVIFDGVAGQEYLIRVGSVLQFGSLNILSGSITIQDSSGGCGCPADYDLSGGVDGSDVEAFFIDWSTAGGCSDANADGGVDGTDVEAFFVAWQAGGC